MTRALVIGGRWVDAQGLAQSWAKILGVEVISPGDEWRGHCRRRTPLGIRIKAHLDAGELLPDDLARDVVVDALDRAGDAWVVYNWPRSAAQAALTTEAGQVPTVAIELTVDESEAMTRLDRRCGHCGATRHVYHQVPREPGVCNGCGGRLGMPHGEAVGEIRRYRDVMGPVADHYRARGVWRVVDAEGGEAEVLARMSAAAGVGA